MTTASADNTTSTSNSAVHMPAHDFEFITPTDYSHSAHNDDGDYFDVLSATTSPTTSLMSSPSELSDMPDPFTTLSADFDPHWDLDTFDSLFPWGNDQAQGAYHCAHSKRSKGICEANEQEQLEGSGLMVHPPLYECPTEHNMMLHPEREFRGSENHDIAEESRVDRKKMKNMNQIILNLNRLGSRLRDDARRQLYVMSDGCDASPLSFGEG